MDLASAVRATVIAVASVRDPGWCASTPASRNASTARHRGHCRHVRRLVGIDPVAARPDRTGATTSVALSIPAVPAGFPPVSLDNAPGGSPRRPDESTRRRCSRRAVPSGKRRLALDQPRLPCFRPQCYMLWWQAWPWSPWIIDSSTHRSNPQPASLCEFDPLLGDLDILLGYLGAHTAAPVHQRCNYGRTHAQERVKHPIVQAAKREDQPLYKFNGKLAWVIGLFDVISLDVWKLPDVAGVLAQWIAGKMAFPRSLEVPLHRILLRHTNRIQVKGIFVALGEPHDYFVSAGESFGCVQSMAEVPHDPIPHTKA